jgi:cytochrome P450
MSLPRRVTQDVSIGGSAPVPAGSMLFLSAAVEHHNPTVYPEPFAFRPQRWLGQETPRPQAFFPFGIGARRCLGAAFADLQARVTLGGIGTVLPRLRLLTTHVDYRMKTGITGSPRAPIMVRFGTGTEPEPAPTPITGTVNVLWRR